MTIDESLLPTDADVAAYEERGWWVSSVVLGADVLDQALDAALTFYRRRDRTLPITTGFSDWRPEHGEDVVRNNEFVSLQSDGLAKFVREPIIGAIAGRLARTTQIRLFDDQLVYKPPRDAGSGTAVGWHADAAYWGTCSSPNMLTAWIPFHDVDEERGTLVVLDGSHRWPESGSARSFNDRDLAGVEARLAGGDRVATRVPLRLRRGQISFHHARTLHASYPNRSDRCRLALAVHLQDRGNEHRAARDADGRPVELVDERLCRRLGDGRPDFADPAVFPVLWEAS